MDHQDLIIRNESVADHSAVYDVNQIAFNRVDEAEIVDAVRRLARPIVSLVAVLHDRVIGHILFSPVDVNSERKSPGAMALGPVAVLPDFQGQGIGTSLIKEGLERCGQLGQSVIFVLGHPDYYPRFGFRPASSRGLYFKSRDFDRYFFVLELQADSADNLSGEVRYLPPFDIS